MDIIRNYQPIWSDERKYIKRVPTTGNTYTLLLIKQMNKDIQCYIRKWEKDIGRISCCRITLPNRLCSIGSGRNT
jgi:hypothetical protein